MMDLASVGVTQTIVDRIRSRRIVLDCRWLAIGGPGRVTSTLLAGLREIHPPGRWVLWGDEELLGTFRWDGAVITRASSPPTRFWGQSSWVECPRGDVVVFLHHYRPLFVRSAAVTLIHDTIPLRVGGSNVRHWLQRVFLRTVASRSAVVLTVSEFAASAIARDLGTARERMRIVPNALDVEFVNQVRRVREASVAAARREIVAVGRFAPHKNLQRLVEAFHLSDLRSSGMRLRLVGGASDEVEMMKRWLAARRFGDGVDVSGLLPDPELAAVVGSACLLTAVSLEEGFGLPAFEAAAAGIPVLASSTGAMSEIPEPNITFCDPRSPLSIASGLGSALAKPAPSPWWSQEHEPVRQAGRFLCAVSEALEP